MGGVREELLKYVAGGRTLRNTARWLYDEYNLKIDPAYLAGYLSGCGVPQTKKASDTSKRLVPVFDGLKSTRPEGITLKELNEVLQGVGLKVTKKFLYGFSAAVGYPLVRPYQSTAGIRKDTILSLKKSGMTYADIGRMLGVTRQRVYQIAKSYKKPVSIVHFDELS